MPSWRQHPVPVSTAVALFAAFLLLLLVSLSLPLIKSIYILEISANLPTGTPPSSIATAIRFGLWGYCASGYTFQNGVQVYQENYLCSKPKLGYSIDPVILQLVQNNQIANILIDSLTYVLVLHPIACGLTLLVSIPAIIRLFNPRIIPGFVTVCTLVMCIIPALVTTVIFVIDIVLVVVARSRIYTATGGSLSVLWGPAVWMTCAATACLWVGLVGLSAFACGCCGLLDEEYEILFRKKYILTRLSEKSKREREEAP